MLRGGNTMKVADKRASFNVETTHQAVADASFPEGYALEVTSTQSLGGHLPAKWTGHTGGPASTYTIYGGARIKVTSSTLAAGSWMDVLSLDDLELSGSGSVGPAARLRFFGDNSVRLAVRSSDGGWSESSAMSSWSLGTVTHWELGLSRNPSGQITVELFKDGLSQGTFTYPSAYSQTWNNVSRVAFGNIWNSQGKSEEMKVRSSLVVCTDTTGASPWNVRPFAVPRFQHEVLLPNGDVPGETQWFTEAGGTGSYTSWDDPLGSWSTADYNETTTQGGTRIQGSTLSDMIATPTSIGCLSVYGYKDVNGSSTNILSIGISDAGSNSTKGAGSYADKTPDQDHWPERPAGGSWTQSAVNGVTTRLIRIDVAANTRVSAHWAVVWYQEPDQQPGTGGFAYTQAYVI